MDKDWEDVLREREEYRDKYMVKLHDYFSCNCLSWDVLYDKQNELLEAWSMLVHREDKVLDIIRANERKARESERVPHKATEPPGWFMRDP